ncbi:MAG: AzlC family ABC transporter permease [Castellaniella sp.]
MKTDSRPLHHLDWPLVRAGVMQMLPLCIFVIVFGVAFGLAANQAGVSGTMSVVMSVLMFAGASQFAALELWGPTLPVAALLLTVFAINARNLLMGATLYPWLCQLPPGRRYAILLMLSDANWAMAMQAFERKRHGLGILVGGGAALWLFWAVGTWLGVYFGGAVRNPTSIGLDMVMACFLFAMVLSGERNLRMFIIWTVAVAVSLLAYRYLPENSHVIAGAVAGGVIGVFWAGPES